MRRRNEQESGQIILNSKRLSDHIRNQGKEPMEIDFEEIQDESQPISTPQDESSPNAADNPPQQTEEEGGEKVPSDWMTIFGPYDLG